MKSINKALVERIPHWEMSAEFQTVLGIGKGHILGALGARPVARGFGVLRRHTTAAGLEPRFSFRIIPALRHLNISPEVEWMSISFPPDFFCGNSLRDETTVVLPTSKCLR